MPTTVQKIRLKKFIPSRNVPKSWPLIETPHATGPPLGWLSTWPRAGPASARALREGRNITKKNAPENAERHPRTRVRTCILVRTWQYVPVRTYLYVRTCTYVRGSTYLYVASLGPLPQTALGPGGWPPQDPYEAPEGRSVALLRTRAHPHVTPFPLSQNGYVIQVRGSTYLYVRTCTYVRGSTYLGVFPRFREDFLEGSYVFPE